MFGKLCLHVRGNAVGYVALFFALAGGAYATTTLAPANSVNSAAIINGQVKQNDLGSGVVSAAKVASNSLTGAQINESTLGQVPRAANANDLGGAPASAFTKAMTLNGDLLGPTATQILATHGLTLTASCNEFPAPSHLSVTATSSTSGGLFEINYIRRSDKTSATPIEHGYVLGTGPATVLTDTFSGAPSGDDNADAGGTFVYTPGSGSGAVTGTFHYYMQNAGGECDVLGNAVPSS